METKKLTKKQKKVFYFFWGESLKFQKQDNLERLERLDLDTLEKLRSLSPKVRKKIVTTKKKKIKGLHIKLARNFNMGLQILFFAKFRNFDL